MVLEKVEDEEEGTKKNVKSSTVLKKMNFNDLSNMNNNKKIMLGAPLIRME